MSITTQNHTGNTRSQAMAALVPVSASPPTGDATITTEAHAKLKRRVKRKGLTEASTERLLALGRNRTPLIRAYERTMRCATVQLVEDGYASSSYCKNRWCTVCEDIKQMKHTLQYASIIRDWQEPTMLTLTLPNVGRKQLHGTVRDMMRTVRRIADRTRKRDRIPFKALRKLEVTYNRTRQDFHPHYHLIFDTAIAARRFRTYWLEAYPDAYRSLQDIRPATDVAELLKYTTKQVVKTKRGFAPIPAWAQDTIYRAVRGLRTLQPMGFKGDPLDQTDADGDLEIPTSTAENTAETTAPPRHYFTWQGEAVQNYVNHQTGELLLNWTPSDGHLALLESIRTAPPDEPPPDGDPPDG